VESEVGSGVRVRRKGSEVSQGSGRKGQGSGRGKGSGVREERGRGQGSGFRESLRRPAGGANQPTSKSLVTFPIRNPSTSTKLTKPPESSALSLQSRRGKTTRAVLTTCTIFSLCDEINE